MNSTEIRQLFFSYFSKHNHIPVPSSSLIPAQDPTLLFTNAGMNQFKDVFLGLEQRSYKRAVSIQKCIRAGGKHNDLENVGFTKRHLTFFEMMGNFSFGDYFKKEAIVYAWEFLTEVIKLDKKRLYASVYIHDTEAYDIWNNIIGLPAERIVKLGEADNFWQMGDTGPCGPCTEIYFDRGLSYECGNTDCKPGCSCDRFLEVWNLVFMQFDRQPDGTDVPLKQKGVDTGMGLERLCAIVQEKDSVFDIDIFAPLIKKIEELTSISYETTKPELQAACRVLVDHIRSTSFAIADGALPSNEGRGYVIRKIIRRAALFAQKLKNENLFVALVPTLVEHMGTVYPELKIQEAHIIATLKSEVEKFQTTFVHGQQLLGKYLRELGETKVISGAQAFKLYDTYGFPLELTKVIGHDHGVTVDSEGFEAHMEQQRIQSGKKQKDEGFVIDDTLTTSFTGYDEHINTAKILGLIVDKKAVSESKAGDQVYVITDQSPFFVECGGQVSDQGFIKKNAQQTPLLALKKIGQSIAALVQPTFTLAVGDTVILEVDSPARVNTMKNHTATHLLQAALIELLGNQVRQSGSVVTPDYLRFDFTYSQNLTPDQITLVEALVNKKICENIPVIVTQGSLKEATDRGVMAIFGEKYNPESVRIVEVPGFSAELCGGTHVRATGDIGLIKITEVTALSAGNRRIVAVTGPAALELFQECFNTVKTLGQEFKVPHADVLSAIHKHKDTLKETQKMLKDAKGELRAVQVPIWVSHVKSIADMPFLFKIFEQVTAEDLKDIGQALVKEKPGFYFLVAKHDDRTLFIAVGHPRIDLKEFATWLKEQGIQGGGAGNSVQGSIPRLDPALEQKISQWLAEHIK